MGDLGNSLLKLHGLGDLLETQGNLELSLRQLAEAAAKILNAAHCSIMLLDEEDQDELKLRVFAAYGDLPDSAYKQITRKGEGISGHVLATGQPLLIEDWRNRVTEVARVDPWKAQQSPPRSCRIKTSSASSTPATRINRPFIQTICTCSKSWPCSSANRSRSCI